MWWCDDNYLIICQHQAHPEEDNEKLCRPPSLCSVLLLLSLSQPLPSFDIKHRGKRRGKCGKLFFVPSVGRRNNKEEK